MVDEIRVVVVDDDPLVCHAMTTICQAGSGGQIRVLASAHTGAAAIDAVIEHSPDVVLMDISMPVMDGLAATEAIRKRPNPPEIIIVTNFDTSDEPLKAARAGASGFLLKSEDPTDIVSAIRAVAAGEGALSRRTAKQLMAHVGAEKNEDVDRARELVGTLTDRELAVARGVTEGQSNDEIASSLYLSPSTVKTHLSSIQAKFGVSSRVLVAVIMTRSML